jgi:hypothetical protein
MLKEYLTVIDQLQRAISLASDSEALFVVINNDIRFIRDGIDRLRIKAVHSRHYFSLYCFSPHWCHAFCILVGILL